MWQGAGWRTVQPVWMHGALFTLLSFGWRGASRLGCTCLSNATADPFTPHPHITPHHPSNQPQELRDLFRLEPSECESSKTQRELHAMHSHQARTACPLCCALQGGAQCKTAPVVAHQAVLSSTQRRAAQVVPGFDTSTL